MKHVKKLLSVILVMIMALTMALPAAAAGNRTLTINSKTSGHTYQAYQVFSGRLDSTGKLLSDIEWGKNIDATKEVDGKTLLAAIQGLDGFNQCQTATQIAEVLAKKETTAETLDTFATIVSKYVKGNPATSTTPTGDATSGYVYTISGLDDGYYFVTEDVQASEPNNAYTKYMLRVAGDTAINAKTDVPSAEKKVKENVKYNQDGGYDNGYNDVADYNIGDKVPFAFYSKVPDMSNFEIYKYIFHDEMSSGLTFNNDVKVTIGGTDVTASCKVEKTNKGFDVIFGDLKTVTGVTTGAAIRIDFTATLNDQAAIGLPGNPNTLTLEYSNNPNDTTKTTTGTPDTVIVFTYELDVTKIDGKDKKELDGVQFKLYREVSGQGAGPSKEYVIVDANGKVTGWTADKDAAGTTLTTSTKGTMKGIFTVSGLDDGIYSLEETQPLDGYNTIKDPIKVTITANTKNGQNWTDNTPGNAFITADADGKPVNPLEITIGEGDKAATTEGFADTGIVSTTVVNNKGVELPGTGGIGTTIFYVVGGILVVGAAVLLIAKKRTK